MKDSKGEKDVPNSLRGEVVFACFLTYNQRMLGTDWDEDDLSDYGKLIAEAKKLAGKTQTNIITEPAGGSPAWQTATTNNITQMKKAAVQSSSRRLPLSVALGSLRGGGIEAEGGEEAVQGQVKEEVMGGKREAKK
uniref:Uncharacterized protein n=1 Tax=Chromera velia CCMP2878 TaxID=1169474 RepID=A0A0G4HAA2_9ALVE|eukprot:Cvel_25479.t1-p1 / transcript=Cvel_25479.t1 / gene=Cvel_25479 / organism=Chromera_velia_CCMP2878 / gene_product=hypothetical protein / transcript_product=hypothetical protein / location=Cvel_scaffold2893:16315-16719(-) / protein_length=135 / sequence_SO=supercontig / SO=protein_coding / is_pseudo=false